MCRITAPSLVYNNSMQSRIEQQHPVSYRITACSLVYNNNMKLLNIRELFLTPRSYHKYCVMVNERSSNY